MKKILISITLFALISLKVTAQENAITTAAPFLLIVPDARAGGMGDVVRDVPRQISERGDKVHVVVPSYEVFNVPLQSQNKCHPQHLHHHHHHQRWKKLNTC